MSARMDGLYWTIAAVALGSAALGAGACFVVMRRGQAALQERIVRAEQARNGAVERSAQAREQIAQLNRAIDEMRRAHSMRPAAGKPVASTTEEQRAERHARAEQALREAGGDATLVLPRGPLQVFADTLPFAREA